MYLYYFQDHYFDSYCLHTHRSNNNYDYFYDNSRHTTGDGLLPNMSGSPIVGTTRAGGMTLMETHLVLRKF